MFEPEVKEPETPTTDERMTKMAAKFGRMKAEKLAESAGAVDADAVADIVAKHAKYEIDVTGEVKISVIDPETGDRLRMPNGEPMTPGQFIAQMKADPDHGYLFADGAAGKPKAKASSGIETESNPWHRDSIHLGRQAELLRTQPEYAKRLQDAARGTLIDNPFSGPGFNLTRQSQILREDPALAERMRAEVAPKEPNPWMAGPTFNLTRQVLILRSNPEKARCLQAEAAASNPVKKDYRVYPPPGAFKRRFIVQK